MAIERTRASAIPDPTDSQTSPPSTAAVDAPVEGAGEDPPRIMGIDGDTHHAAALEIEGDVDGLPVETIELGDGIAGGGVEAEGEHGQISVGNTTQEEAG